ncbi:MAG: hypothetical protein Q9184_004070 [Pyrenodesmia sp. 2 TL-2023]
MRFITTLLCLAGSVGAQQAWSGWQNINKVFVFGASYAANGFDIDGVQPDVAASNPFGNPPGTGLTSSNGPNVFGYLTTVYNESLISTYNLAVSGAVVDGFLYADQPHNDFIAQVHNKFLPHYFNQETAGWTSAQTIFAVFFAINDVLRSYRRSDNPLEEMFATYTHLIEEVSASPLIHNPPPSEKTPILLPLHQLYYTGARTFLLLNAPPIDRSPFMTSMAPILPSPHHPTAFITTFNDRLTALANYLRTTYPDIKIFLFDTHTLFVQILDDPLSLPQTVRVRNTDGFCPAYNRAPAMDWFDPMCGLRVDEYFWSNELHPTWPVHDAMAGEIVGMLRE